MNKISGLLLPALIAVVLGFTSCYTAKTKVNGCGCGMGMRMRTHM